MHFDFSSYKPTDAELLHLSQSASKYPFLILPSPVEYVRKQYFNGLIDFDWACKMIDVRRDTPCYLFFNVPDKDGNIITVKAKTPFRGNDVYRGRVWNRHKDLLMFCECNKGVSYIRHSSDIGDYSQILKFTLTVDINSWSRDEFNIFYGQYFYDLFIKRIRNEFPGVVFAKSLEVSTKKARGYLHYNLIAIFPDHKFPVYNHVHKRRDTRGFHVPRHDSRGNPVKSWRLKDYSTKVMFSDMWDAGFVDVRAVTCPTDLAEYSLKYHIKDFTNLECKSNQKLTLSTLSLFNKRAFSFPNASSVRGTLNFAETVVNYTVGLDPMETIFFPACRLDIINHNSLECEFLGHFVDYYAEYASETWFEIVDKPPDSLDPLILYEGCFDYAPVLCSFDSGSRLDPESGEYVHISFVEPKYTFQKNFRVCKYDSDGHVVNGSVKCSSKSVRSNRRFPYYECKDCKCTFAKPKSKVCPFCGSCSVEGSTP